ncbi:hypothetical protein CgunFtcFv8_018812 [Champsocephalus gunnari]|uniref:Uncharacterized protein n=1 Tax=Champsocephalus gunnari TaxID=52237 RepID=A0AAN8GXG3_CHAGU|nr:hypothetical protein CgunFtcFv8_018812 [Champsocephalus gunnari]
MKEERKGGGGGDITKLHLKLGLSPSESPLHSLPGIPQARLFNRNRKRGCCIKEIIVSGNQPVPRRPPPHPQYPGARFMPTSLPPTPIFTRREIKTNRGLFEVARYLIPSSLHPLVCSVKRDQNPITVLASSVRGDAPLLFLCDGKECIFMIVQGHNGKPQASVIRREWK